MNKFTNIAKQKKCSSCSSSFVCGDTESASCWCNQYPPIFKLDYNQDCLCSTCLHQATLEKTNEYVAHMIETGVKNNIAAGLKSDAPFIAGLDYYIEKGFWVFTAWHHLKRGSCCKSGCRHCPYGFKKV